MLERIHNTRANTINRLVIPEQDLIEASQTVLASRIQELQVLLDQVESIETREKIEFEIALYTRFLSENGVFHTLL